jgi:sigma-B regulation protein RsbU (phosphoserine phosphatase)
MDYRSLLKNVEKTLSAIDGSEDVVSTVAAVGEAVVGNFRSELGIIGGRLYQREDNDYVLKRGFGRSRKVPEGLAVPVSYGPIHRALDEGVVLADLKDPSVDRELEARLGVTRFAAVSFGDGAFILSFDVHPRVAADDLLVSLGIIRTVLDSKVRSERLESLLEEARRIQQSILPRSLPEIGDYEIWAISEPAEAVGGDFYDFIPLTADSFGAAIADASGHGLLAALLVRDVYVGLRMGIGGDLKIARAVERLNRILNKSRLATKFVSLFYGELEANGEVIYVNAGHPGPLHLHARTRSFSEMESTGMVLGPSPNAIYGRRATKLEPGDLLLLYTDGIVEAHDHRGREFGLDRVRRILLDYRKRTARETAEKLLTSVRDFSAGRPAEDDRTVVVIRRTGRQRGAPGPAGGAVPPAIPPTLG